MSSNNRNIFLFAAGALLVGGTFALFSDVKKHKNNQIEINQLPSYSSPKDEIVQDNNNDIELPFEELLNGHPTTSCLDYTVDVSAMKIKNPCASADETFAFKCPRLKMKGLLTVSPTFSEFHSCVFFEDKTSSDLLISKSSKRGVILQWLPSLKYKLKYIQSSSIEKIVKNKSTRIYHILYAQHPLVEKSSFYLYLSYCVLFHDQTSLEIVPYSLTVDYDCVVTESESKWNNTSSSSSFQWDSLVIGSCNLLTFPISIPDFKSFSFIVKKLIIYNQNESIYILHHSLRTGEICYNNSYKITFLYEKENDNIMFKFLPSRTNVFDYCLPMESEFKRGYFHVWCFLPNLPLVTYFVDSNQILFPSYQNEKHVRSISRYEVAEYTIDVLCLQKKEKAIYLHFVENDVYFSACHCIYLTTGEGEEEQDTWNGKSDLISINKNEFFVYVSINYDLLDTNNLKLRIDS
jgi:predicted ribosomally synthesized peptide with SipW-like signal peptide